jgi:hypothetical protein
MKRLGVALSVLVSAATFGPIPAFAQGWLSDRSRAEGPGIRFGDFELHPGIGIEAGFDSNVFLSESNELGSGILRVTPHVYLSTLSTQRLQEGIEGQSDPPPVSFETGVYASYYEFFEQRPPDNLGVGASFNLHILPRRPFSVLVNGDYERRIRPFTELGDGNEEYGLNRGFAGLGFRYSTSGEVFTIDTGYRLDFRIFEGTDFRFGNSLEHNVQVKNVWRFLPSTAFVFDANLGFQTYINREDVRPGSSLVSDGVSLDPRVGINGAISNSVSFLLMAGYGVGFFQDDDLREYDSVIANAELSWQPQGNTTLTVGYDRSFQPSVIGGFFRQDRGYIRSELLFAGRVLVGATAHVAGVEFGRLIDADGDPLGTEDGSPTDQRSDLRYGVDLFAEYRFTDWLALNATFGYLNTSTDFAFDRLVDEVVVPDAADFQKFEVFGGVRAFY